MHIIFLRRIFSNGQQASINTIFQINKLNPEYKYNFSLKLLLGAFREVTRLRETENRYQVPGQRSLGRTCFSPGDPLGPDAELAKWTRNPGEHLAA